MFIDDWSYKYGQWKHVMHKGNESSWPLRAPGMWLHPKENILITPGSKEAMLLMHIAFNGEIIIPAPGRNYSAPLKMVDEHL